MESIEDLVSQCDKKTLAVWAKVLKAEGQSRR